MQQNESMRVDLRKKYFRVVFRTRICNNIIFNYKIKTALNKNKGLNGRHWSQRAIENRIYSVNRRIYVDIAKPMARDI